MMTLTDDQRMLHDSVAPFMAEEGSIKRQLRHWRDIGLPMSRAEAANADPRFIEMLAELVLKTMRRYERGRPLSLTSTRASGRSSG